MTVVVECVRERKREIERGRETERQRDRETERQRDRETESRVKESKVEGTGAQAEGEERGNGNDI
jgi:hypothetical protein